MVDMLASGENIRVEGEGRAGVPGYRLNDTGAIYAHCVKFAYPDGVSGSFS
jgi:hypothetical protein